MKSLLVVILVVAAAFLALVFPPRCYDREFRAGGLLRTGR